MSSPVTGSVALERPPQRRLHRRASRRGCAPHIWTSALQADSFDSAVALLKRDRSAAPTFTFVPPFTDFSKEADIDMLLGGGRCLDMQKLTEWPQ